MKNEDFYKSLVSKMHEIGVVPPQNIGPLTPFYKKLVPKLKYFPFKALFPVSFMAILAAYLIFGVWLVKLAEILQKSF